MSPGEKDALEAAVKTLGVAGAFLSALGGTFLGIDAVKEETTERFRAVWTYVPGLAVIPLIWIIVLFCDREVALLPQFFWGLLVGFILLLLMFAARFTLFWHDERLFHHEQHGAKKIGWIILVFGFDLILFQQVVDAFSYWYGR